LSAPPRARRSPSQPPWGLALGALTALGAAASAGMPFADVHIATMLTCLAVAELQRALAQCWAARAGVRLAFSGLRG
jgi:hypothetical protein